jgi:hypothetical protein
MGTKVTVRGRLSYPNMFEAGKSSTNAQGESIEGKFGAQIIIPKNSEDHKKVRAAVYTEAETAWGKNWANIVKTMDKSKVCLRAGEMQVDKAGNVRDGYGPEVVYVSARNKAQPRVVAKGFINGKPVDLDKMGNAYQGGKPLPGISRKVPYAGSYCNFVIDISAGDIPKAGKSIWAKLLSIQFAEDGNPFSATATDEDIADEGDDGTEDSTGDPLDDTPAASAKGGKAVDPLDAGDDDDDDPLP